MIKSITLLFVTALLNISGCSTPEYTCGVPGGIGCKPLRKVQQMAEDGQLIGQPAPDRRDQDTTNFDDDDNEEQTRQFRAEHVAEHCQHMRIASQFAL